MNRDPSTAYCSAGMGHAAYWEPPVRIIRIAAGLAYAAHPRTRVRAYARITRVRAHRYARNSLPSIYLYGTSKISLHLNW